MNNWLEQALKYESENNLLLSTQCYTRALKECPTDKDVLYYGGLFLSKMGNYDEALDLFVRCYSLETLAGELKEELLSRLLAAYYEPNIKELKETYEDNVKNLLAYEFNYIGSFPAFEDLSFICIPRNDSSYYIFDKETNTFLQKIDIRKSTNEHPIVAPNECVIAFDIYEKEQLLSLHEKNHMMLPNGIKVPFYLVWTNTKAIQFYLQLADYGPIINTGRFVFFPDYRKNSSVASFFADSQSMIPNKCIGIAAQAEVQSFFKNIKESREKETEEKFSKVMKLAESYDDHYYKDLFLNHTDDLRILFITCRFTTFLQYCTRDCMSASIKLGIKSDFLIEKSDIHRIFQQNLYSKILDFKPNVIFILDHFKWEFDIPQNFLCVTWVQDPLPLILSSDSAARMSKRDLVMVSAKGLLNDMLKLGYPESNLFYQIVPVNTDVFFERDVSETEKGHYGSDITYVSHPGNPEALLKALIQELTSELDSDTKQKWSTVLHTAYETTASMIENSKPVFTVEDYKQVLNDAARRCGVKLNVTDEMAYDFGFHVGNRLHRATPLTWLTERGYSLKIWGREWVNNQRLKMYAMGTAANGDELAKVNSCSKIALGIQPYNTMHMRAFEAMACGCLYLCKSLPEEHDYDNINDYFIEGEDFVSFNDKKDLLNKVSYYLNNEEERKRIAENGRKKTIENYTYTNAMKNCLSFISATVKHWS